MVKNSGSVAFGSSSGRRSMFKLAWPAPTSTMSCTSTTELKPFLVLGLRNCGLPHGKPGEVRDPLGRSERLLRTRCAQMQRGRRAGRAAHRSAGSRPARATCLPRATAGLALASGCVWAGSSMSCTLGHGQSAQGEEQLGLRRCDRERCRDVACRGDSAAAGRASVSRRMAARTRMRRMRISSRERRAG